VDLITFNQRVKHGRLDFHPKLVYGFEDPDAAPYFKRCGWAIDVPDDQEPDVVVTMDELDIDPLTVFGHDHDELGRKRGQFVMPERASAHLMEQGHSNATPEWAETYVATFVPGAELIDHMKAEGTLSDA
jgi:hypothetical protein